MAQTEKRLQWSIKDVGAEYGLICPLRINHKSVLFQHKQQTHRLWAYAGKEPIYI